MITFYQLEKRINDLTHSIVPQDVYFTTIHNARLEVLKWVKNENEIRPECEILNRIDRYKEEMLAFPDESNLWYKALKVRIEELNNVVSPED